MINCERCGTAIPDTAAICSSCGTTSPFARSGPTLLSDYGQPDYAQGYGSQQGYNPQPSPVYSPQPSSSYLPEQGYAPQQIYNQPYNNPPPIAYSPPVSVNINAVAPITRVAPSGNSGAVAVEVLLNLFLGIYGVGWLMAGEWGVGIILLICSFVLYWPILLLSIIRTIIALIWLASGGSLLWLFLGPLVVIGLIVLNAVLLNNAIKRKAFVMVQPMQPIQNYPPR
jgi:hypothetical protein